MSNTRDIKRVRREKTRLQRLEKSIATWRLPLTADLSAKNHIKAAIEQLHMAELDLIKGDF